jgi:hypothetical protein
LESVGYSGAEVEALAQDYPPILSLNVCDQLAPKIRFLVETLGGGTGQLTWNAGQQDGYQHPILQDDDECLLSSDFNSGSAVHSMRLNESTKRTVPAHFYGCPLDRTVGPYHAYLIHHHLPHGSALLSNREGCLDLFLESCSRNVEDFCGLCNEWEKPKGNNNGHLHTVAGIQSFVTDFCSGLLPAAKATTSFSTNKNDHEIALLLFHGANPFEPDSHGVLPLHWAAGTGNLEGFQALLAASREGEEPIFETIRKAQEPKDGATPFHWACSGISTEFVGEGGTRYQPPTRRMHVF